MIGGLSKLTGDHVGTLINYLIRSKVAGGTDRGRVLGGTILADTRMDIIHSFRALLDMHPGVVSPIQHIWASARRGEPFDDAAKLWVGEQLAARFGWDAWVCISHSGPDVPTPHVHYVGSRCRWDGTVAREFLRDYRLVEDVMVAAEVKFGLSAAPRADRPPAPHGRTRAASRSTNREGNLAKGGRLSRKADLRQQIEQRIEKGLRGYRLLMDLQEASWTPDLRWKNGRPSSITWHHASGFSISGRSLGESFRVGPFLRRIGGIPGISGNRPLPRNWTVRPYRWRPLDHVLSRPDRRIGLASGCSWWGRAAAWAWGLFRSSTNSSRPAVQAAQAAPFTASITTSRPTAIPVGPGGPSKRRR